MIINEFYTEKDLVNFYPKDKYFKLKDIFNDYWDDFLLFAYNRNLTIRQVVKHEVNKMMICKTPLLGYSFYHCPNCDNHIHVYNTCKSRFCNSCGVKYAKARSLAIESKLINCNHRHLVFTISDILWPLFLEKRTRLNLMFDAVNNTISSWFKQLYKKENINLVLFFLFILLVVMINGTFTFIVYILKSL